MPNNAIRFYFGSHGTKQDVLDAYEHFRWCTVYCPEGAGHNKESHRFYRRVSFGAVRDIERLFAELPPSWDFYVGQLSLLENSRKHVVFLDLPKEDSLEYLLDTLTRCLTTIAYGDRTYRRAQEECRSYFSSYVTAQRHRERYILEQLMRLDDRLENERILMRMGTCHFRMAQLANIAGLRVERAFQRGHFRLFALCYHYANCLGRIPEPLMARYLFSALLSRWTCVRTTVRDQHAREHIFWRTANRFPESEIQVLWEQCRANPEHAGETLLQALRRRDVT